MSERTKKFADDLERLIIEGDQLYMAMQYACYSEKFKERLLRILNEDDAEVKKILATLPDFNEKYQKWYSEAQALIKQVLPDRLSDFVSYYEYPRVRKEITFENYMIRDYLQGLRVTRGGDEVIVDSSAAIPEFVQQLNIVKAAMVTLDSVLLDLKAVLQADLFDTEIESSTALAKAGYLRASGAICGVVIEKHLLHVCDVHGVTFRKKNPEISDLNQLLRDAGVTTVPQWRFVQHLADIRNICDHAKGREPTREEINDLISGSEKVLKTIF